MPFQAAVVAMGRNEQRLPYQHIYTDLDLVADAHVITPKHEVSEYFN